MLILSFACKTASSGRFFCVDHRRQMVQHLAVLLLRGCGINAGGVDAAVAQKIRELHHIPCQLIKHPGKEMPQSVGVDLLRVYSCSGAKSLQPLPYPAAIQRLSPSGAEDHTGRKGPFGGQSGS